MSVAASRIEPAASPAAAANEKASPQLGSRACLVPLVSAVPLLRGWLDAGAGVGQRAAACRLNCSMSASLGGCGTAIRAGADSGRGLKRLSMKRPRVRAGGAAPIGQVATTQAIPHRNAMTSRPVPAGLHAKVVREEWVEVEGIEFPGGQMARTRGDTSGYRLGRRPEHDCGGSAPRVPAGFPGSTSRRVCPARLRPLGPGRCGEIRTPS